MSKSNPLTCEYYVTYRCNSRCSFCNIWKKSSEEPSFETLKKNLMDLKRLGVKIIDFTGGEPLLYKHIVEAFSLAKDLGFRTTLTTNGTLYKNYGLKLKGLIDILNISLDTLNKERYKEIRGIDALDKVLESIDFARKIGEKIYLLKTVSDDDFDELDDLVKFAQLKRVTLKLNPVFVYFDTKNKKFSLSSKTINKIRELAKKPYVIADFAHYSFIEDGSNNKDKPVCKAVSRVLTISPDNRLLLPCYYHKFKEIEIRDNLYELCFSKEVQDEIKNVGRYDFCNGCYINCYFRYYLYDNPKYWFDFLRALQKQVVEHYLRR
ncbi:MAG: hypothetical protein PWP03_513 [Candidatus Woesearchaeota archaeon]|nr:hypothetical protein [Candidatus Woesearchaeota archaeon]MDN5327875.1 hypothetical protein [Candidatus Woesearchaeota archaeon]